MEDLGVERNSNQTFMSINSFIIKLDISVEKIESESQEVFKFLARFKEQILVDFKACRNTMHNGTSFGTLIGPIVFVFDHPMARRKTQIETVKKVYTSWFRSCNVTSNTRQLVASISYGAVDCWESDEGHDRNEFSGLPLSLAIKAGEASFEDNQISEPYAILSDDRSSEILFSDQPLRILRNTGEYESVPMQMRIPNNCD